MYYVLENFSNLKRSCDLTILQTSDFNAANEEATKLAAAGEKVQVNVFKRLEDYIEFDKTCNVDLIQAEYYADFFKKDYIVFKGDKSTKKLNLFEVINMFDEYHQFTDALSLKLYIESFHPGYKLYSIELLEKEYKKMREEFF